MLGATPDRSWEEACLSPVAWHSASSGASKLEDAAWAWRQHPLTSFERSSRSRQPTAAGRTVLLVGSSSNILLGHVFPNADRRCINLLAVFILFCLFFVSRAPTAQARLCVHVASALDAIAVR